MVKTKEQRNEYSRKWRAKNPEKFREAVRKWQAKNPEKRREYNRKFSEKNPEYVKEWREKNPEYQNEWAKAKRKTNPNFRIQWNMRSAMSHALAGRKKSASTMEIIGCSVEELFEHLGSCEKWEPWMTRGRYGKGGWDVDHIIAIEKWDKKCPLQFALCWDKSNLQPMGHIANIKKGAR